VAATPDDHPNLATRLNNLGSKLESRFERTGSMEDLEEASQRAGQAVSATPDDHPNLAGMLNNQLESRFGRTGRIEDAIKAIVGLPQRWR
jgi:hypothetical protein